MSGSFVTPDGQYPPFTVVTETDHTAWIVIATAVGIPVILVFGVIRTFVRRTSSIGLDDKLIALATFLAILQATLIFIGCSYGLGKAIEDVPRNALSKIQKIYYASTLIFIIALAISKASVAALLLRLSGPTTSRPVFIAELIYAAVWMVLSIFLVALQCNLSYPWVLVGEKCPDVFVRWQVVGALDIIFEVGVVLSSIYLVYRLQAETSMKITVVSVFSVRLLLIVFVAFRLDTFPRAQLTTNPTLRLDLFIIWTQTELNWSIISATIPSLRPFLRGLSTSAGTSSEYSTGRQHRSRRNEYMLSDLSRDGQKGSIADQPRLRDDVDDAVTRRSGRNRVLKGNSAHVLGDATSVGSNDSQGMIIRKDVTWAVDHERSGARSDSNQDFTEDVDRDRYI